MFKATEKRHGSRRVMSRVTQKKDEKVIRFHNDKLDRDLRMRDKVRDHLMFNSPAMGFDYEEWTNNNPTFGGVKPLNEEEAVRIASYMVNP